MSASYPDSNLYTWKQATAMAKLHNRAVIRLEFINLLRPYWKMITFAIKRANNLRDAWVLTLMLCAPFLYFLNFRGLINTPIGKLNITNREILRTTIYSLFKHWFTYQKIIRKIMTDELSFGVVFDIGANIGDFTLALSKRSQKVIAIEPAEIFFHVLRKNILANHIENILPLRVAAHGKHATIYLEGSGGDRYVVEKPTHQKTAGIPVDCLAQSLGVNQITIMKIDVQGHEMKVLLGLQQLLAHKTVKLLIVELHPRVSQKEVLKFMTGSGYKLIYVDKYLFNQIHLYFTVE